MKFWASFPQIYRFRQAKPIRKLTIRMGPLESENLRKSCTQISCKVISVLLSPKLPTSSRWVTKCKPEWTIRNCDMAYYQLHVFLYFHQLLCCQKLIKRNIKRNFKVLSNIDHVTPIPFGHFAIVLTSWYRQHLHLCREDLRKAIMTSWDTWRFPAKLG